MHIPIQQYAHANLCAALTSTILLKRSVRSTHVGAHVGASSRNVTLYAFKPGKKSYDDYSKLCLYPTNFASKFLHRVRAGGN